MPRNPLLFPPSLSLLLQAQNISSPKWPSTTYALSLPNTAACAASLYEPLQLQIWTPFPLSASLFPTVRQSATSSHTTFSPIPESTQRSSSTFTLLGPSTDRPSALHCHPHPFALSSSPPQAGCRRYNPSKVTLSSTVRSLPTCLVEMRTCLSRMTNLYISRPLSITVSTVSNWRREVPQRKTIPFLMTQFRKVPKCSILIACLLFLDLSLCSKVIRLLVSGAFFCLPSASFCSKTIRLLVLGALGVATL